MIREAGEHAAQCVVFGSKFEPESVALDPVGAGTPLLPGFRAALLGQRLAVEFLQVNVARLDEHIHHRLDRAKLLGERRGGLVIRRLRLVPVEAEVKVLRPLDICGRGLCREHPDGFLEQILEGHFCDRLGRQHAILQLLFELRDFVREFRLLRDEFLQVCRHQARLRLVEFLQLRSRRFVFRCGGVGLVHRRIREVAEGADAREHHRAKPGQEFIFGNPVHWKEIGFVSFNGSTNRKAHTSTVSSFWRM